VGRLRGARSSAGRFLPQSLTGALTWLNCGLSGRAGFQGPVAEAAHSLRVLTALNRLTCYLARNAVYSTRMSSSHMARAYDRVWIDGPSWRL